jgi:hypothetical protein
MNANITALGSLGLQTQDLLLLLPCPELLGVGDILENNSTWSLPAKLYSSQSPHPGYTDSPTRL